MPIKKLPTLLDEQKFEEFITKYNIDDEAKSYLSNINNYLFTLKQKEKVANANKYKVNLGKK
jgi:hypothetical protein